MQESILYPRGFWNRSRIPSEVQALRRRVPLFRQQLLLTAAPARTRRFVDGGVREDRARGEGRTEQRADFAG